MHAPNQTQVQAQAQTQNEMKLALTYQDYLNLKYLLRKPMEPHEVWKKLPKEVQEWLEKNGFSDPCHVIDPVDALYRLAMALAYGEDYYDYSVDVIKTDNGDAIVIDIWIPTLGYDIVIVVLPDGEVIAFQYG